MATILMTGGTGLIGGAVIHEATRKRSGDRWICLVRAAGEERARERLAARLARFCSPSEAARLLRKVEIIAGDFTQADWTDDARLADVTHVLHLAADTSWWGDEKVFRTNHRGTLDFAARMAALPKLKRFVHVSTAMICGGASEKVVHEASYPSEDAVHLVSYSRSKACAETDLRRELPELPLVVARPSIVVGHTRLGARPSASILWMFRAADRLRLVGCDLDGSVDVVPSDWVASSLIGLLRKRKLAHDTYHLSAGLGQRASWQSLGRAFEAVDPAGGARHYERLHPAERGVLQKRFKEAFGLGSARTITMMRAMQAYYRFCELGVTFDNQRLLDEGFAPPPSFADYLPVCVDPDRDIVSQFADDVEMFSTDDAATPRRARVSAGVPAAPQRTALLASA